MEDAVMKHPIGMRLATSALIVIMSGAASANGLFENRSWQFRTSADRANNAVVLDMIERKKGGYYDGFSVTNNHTTNIGTQVNCSNVADATGNIAQNSQTANSPNVNNSTETSSSSAGNVADNNTAGDGQDGIGNDQGNSGNVSSGISNSNTSSSSGPINGGPSNQDLHNHQNNSGNQYASASGTACDMTGSTVSGSVNSTGVGALN